MMKNVIVNPGGVVSSLGKGTTAASLGRLLKARGYKVAMQKCDTYDNFVIRRCCPLCSTAKISLRRTAWRLTLT